jgi:hypothetical protein
MVRVLAGVLAMVSSVAAQAAVVGTWEGPATYTNDEGASQDFVVQVILESSGDQLAFAESAFQYTFQFTVAGDQVLYNGAAVGTVSDSQFHVEFADPYADPAGPACTVDYTLGADGHYVDNYHCDDGFFDHVDGMLASQKVTSAFAGTHLTRRR